jgi:RNA polymerase nonessential primary-like sigma factor
MAIQLDPSPVLQDTDLNALATTPPRRSTDLVRIYLQDIGRVQLLDRAEEVSEAQKVKAYVTLLEARAELAKQDQGLLATYVDTLTIRDQLTAQLGHRPSLDPLGLRVQSIPQ